MNKKIIYTAKIDRVFYPNGRAFTLEKNSLTINIKGERELESENPIVYYYDMPYYVVTMTVKDQNDNRSFVDFKEDSDKILSSFSKWLIDIHGVKVSVPIFDKGYVNNDEVNAQGGKLIGSGSATIYKIPIHREISTTEIEGVFNNLDNTNGKLDYVRDSENYFAIRRDIFQSQDLVGSFISLYGFLQEVIVATTQKATDEYIRNQPIYDSKNDRRTSKPNQFHKETLITWLRNQVGHFNIDTTEYIKVTAEIYNWHEILYEITLSAIQQKKNNS